MLLIVTISVITTQKVFCQENDNFIPAAISKKHAIGFQFNPYLGRGFFSYLISGDLKVTYWAVGMRYAIKQPYAPNLSFGLDAKLYFGGEKTVYSGQMWRIGPLVRYEFLHYKRITFFGEGVVNANYIVYKSYINDDKRKEFKAGAYISPGLNFRSKNEKFSLDISYMVATYYSVYNKKHAPTFKIYYHF